MESLFYQSPIFFSKFFLLWNAWHNSSVSLAKLSSRSLHVCKTQQTLESKYLPSTSVWVRFHIHSIVPALLALVKTPWGINCHISLLSLLFFKKRILKHISTARLLWKGCISLPRTRQMTVKKPNGPCQSGMRSIAFILCIDQNQRHMLAILPCRALRGFQIAAQICT